MIFLKTAQEIILEKNYSYTVYMFLKEKKHKGY